jgi:acetoacetate decarboxylase
LRDYAGYIHAIEGRQLAAMAYKHENPICPVKEVLSTTHFIAGPTLPYGRVRYDYLED